jgi:hypothetical protein
MQVFKRVVVDVDAVGFLTGVVDAVAAHGQVVSPSMRVKKSHLTDFAGFCSDPVYAFAVYGWSCILCYRPVHTPTRNISCLV